MNNNNHKCELCNSAGHFALYELHDDLTKKWRSSLCGTCDRVITRHNEFLKKMYDVREFIEVHDV